jgi:hypothetical protein
LLKEFFMPQKSTTYRALIVLHRPQKLWMHAFTLFACTSIMACSVAEPNQNLIRPSAVLSEANSSISQAPGREPNNILLHSKKNRGVIQTDLESAGAMFTENNYDTVLFSVDANEKSQLASLALAEIEASRQVILDSNGSDSDKDTIADVAMLITGLGTRASGVLISRVEEGVMAVTPIETEKEFRQRQVAAGKRISRGNTARYLLQLDL